MPRRHAISIRAEMHERIRAHCQAHGVSMSSVVEQAVATVGSDLVAVSPETKARAEAHAAKQGLTTGLVVDLAVERFTRRGD